MRIIDFKNSALKSMKTMNFCGIICFIGTIEHLSLKEVHTLYDIYIDTCMHACFIYTYIACNALLSQI